MTNQFISPNWHPLLIHYPLGFLSAGIAIEMLSFLWPRGSFRTAGRWMILLGALASMPALAAGIYAYRIVVGGGAAEPRMVPWHQAVAQSSLTASQWHFLAYHVWLNSIGVVVVVAAVAVWVAATDAWRRTLYWPTLLALVCGMGLFAAGSWFGGEAVYRLGMAVELQAAGTAAAPATDDTGHTPPGAHQTQLQGVKWVLPPLELHVVLAGVVLAIMLGALALSIRHLEPAEARAETLELVDAAGPSPGSPETAAQETVDPIPATVPMEPPLPPPITHPSAGRFWILVCVAALITGIAGLWSAAGAFTSQRISQNVAELKSAPRFFIHAILATALILLPLIVAALARWGRRRRGITFAFLVLALLAIGFQFWLGIAMFYDGHKGPIIGFNAPSHSTGH
jgi:uncharacterized membrane protein